MRAKLHARLLELRTEAADAAARAEMLVISPEEMQEVTSAALAGELGEGLAAVALARIEELAGEARPREGDMKDALRHIYETARHARRSHKTVT